MDLRKLSAMAALAALSWSATAQAWMRMHYEDAELVDRSEAIVVGRLDKDAIKWVPHNNGPDRGASWEHHATLIVTEALKGPLKGERVAIVINYGLDPLIGGRSLKDNAGSSFSRSGNVTADQIDLVDTGGMGGPPFLENAQKDNLWFLRHLGGELGREAGKGGWGILDPEDVQPLKLVGYFEVLLCGQADRDKHLDRLLSQRDEVVCTRVLRYLAARHRPEDASRVARLLTGGSEKLQAAAAEALAELADISAVPTFREALGSPNAVVRLIACGFLCRFRDTQSIAAIAKLLPGFDSRQREWLVRSLPRMQSRQVVDLLLDRLDEQLGPDPSAMSAYSASVSAAGALKALTCIEFPLDANQARRRWSDFKALPEEVLLRKAMLEDIEALTSPGPYETRWNAYEALGRLANQHLGSYDAFHGSEHAAGREESQRMWRMWAKQNITRPRIDWIYEGFARSGIDLPRPMNADGIDTLMAVLEFYGDWGNRKRAPARPAWSVDGGWVKAGFHRANANWLLERLTGYRVGPDPQPYDYLLGYDFEGFDLQTTRWSAWWKENRRTARLAPPPEEPAVTAEMLAKIPPLHLPPPPLTLTIRPAREVHILKGNEPLAIAVEVKNTSAQAVVVERRPTDLNYGDKHMAGGIPGGGRGGKYKEDFATLKPGQSITWDQKDAPSLENAIEPRSLEGLHYKLIWCSAGSQFGLRAWRGQIVSNEINVAVKAKAEE